MRAIRRASGLTSINLSRNSWLYLMSGPVGLLGPSDAVEVAVIDCKVSRNEVLCERGG